MTKYLDKIANIFIGHIRSDFHTIGKDSEFDVIKSKETFDIYSMYRDVTVTCSNEQLLKNIQEMFMANIQTFHGQTVCDFDKNEYYSSHNERRKICDRYVDIFIGKIVKNYNDVLWKFQIEFHECEQEKLSTNSDVRLN